MNRKQAANLVNCAYLAFLATGVVLPLLKSDKKEKQRGLRALETLGAAVLAGQSLKHIIREQRPDGTDRASFPSGHTTYSFVIAAISSAFQRKQALLWYGGALSIGAARVLLRRHHLRDMLAGALLGLGLACAQLRCKQGWILKFRSKTEVR